MVLGSNAVAHAHASCRRSVSDVDAGLYSTQTCSCMVELWSLQTKQLMSRLGLQCLWSVEMQYGHMSSWSHTD